MSGRGLTRRRARRALVVLSGVLAAAVLALWQFTPVGDLVDPGKLAAWLETIRSSPGAAPAIVGVFLVGGLTMFPLTVLIAATALVFEPARAFALSFVGAMASATVLYSLGERFVRGTLHAALGSAVRAVNAALADRSVIAIAALRLVPVAPFSLVNLAAGSVGLRFREYALGTALGLSPGIAALTLFGAQLRSVWEEPTVWNVGAVLAIVFAWLTASILLQRAIARRKRSGPGVSVGARAAHSSGTLRLSADSREAANRKEQAHRGHGEQYPGTDSHAEPRR